MERRKIYRILDANFNRSREGLRVCEEIARFALEDKKLTRRLKVLRHAVSRQIAYLGVPYAELVACRDSRSDVGKESTRSERGRKSDAALFVANIERVKEALRVLEETSKLLPGCTPENFKKIRFGAYTLEREILQKLEVVRHHRRRKS